MCGPYRFRAEAALLILTVLSGSRSCGVVITKLSNHVVTFRSSPTVFADTPVPTSASTRILAGKPLRAMMRATMSADPPARHAQAFLPPKCDGGANLGADMKNQSMGLMRAVLKSSNLERAILRDADLSRVDLEFTSLKNADLTNASLRGAALGGATLARVTVNGTDFNGADLVSTRLIEPIGLDAAKNFDKAQNTNRLLRE